MWALTEPRTSFHPLIAGPVSQTDLFGVVKGGFSLCFHPLIAGPVSQTKHSQSGGSNHVNHVSIPS